MTYVVALQEGGGQLGDVARTFGVDWPHLGAQIVSFGIVCAVLYALAYKPVLRMLEARRQQIAAGLANADKIKTELARIESDDESLRMPPPETGLTLSAAQRATLRQWVEEGAEFSSHWSFEPLPPSVAIPVVEDERMIGIISIGDVVKLRLHEMENEQSALRDYIQTA